MTTSLAKYDFHGDALDLVEHEGQGYAALRPMCDALGIALSPQRTKLSSKAWARMTMIVTHDSMGRKQEMLCLHIDSVAMWLATIETSKVAESVRGKLVRYQLECARVLRDHFAPREIAPAPAVVVDLNLVHGPSIGQVPDLRAELIEECSITMKAARLTLARVHGVLRQVYRVPSVYFLSTHEWPNAKRTLRAIALGKLHVRAPEQPRQLPPDRRQVTMPWRAN